MLLVSANAFYRIQVISDTQDRLTQLRQPTVLAGQSLINGINLSLAGLRGYMILGSDQQKGVIFKNERAQGWTEIDNAIETLHTISESWTDPKNIEYLKEIDQLVEQFRSAQQEVESISHTPDNIPAFNMLLTEAAPRAAKVIASITSMIEAEAELESTSERKRLLKLMADSRGSFAVALANIRAYLLSGDVAFMDAFQSQWKINNTRFKQIEAVSNLFSPRQQVAWKQYKSMRDEFSAFPSKMFESRAGDEWNLANYWLGTKAAPKAKKIMDILALMRQSQDDLSAVDSESLSQDISLLK